MATIEIKNNTTRLYTMEVKYLALMSLLLVQGISLSSLHQSCVLSLCNAWYTKRVNIFTSSRSSENYSSDLARMLLSQGIRVTEHEIYSNKENSNVIFSDALAYTHTMNVITCLDDVTKHFFHQYLASEMTSRFITWLLVMKPCTGIKSEISIQRELAEVDIPYNTRVFILVDTPFLAVYQVYRISAHHPLTITRLNECHATEKVARMTRMRAPNLQGVVVTAVMGTPVQDNVIDEWTEAYIDLWQHLATSLNFTLKVKALNDSRLPESSWIRLLSEVQNKAAHVSLAPILMLPSTSVDITFSTPIHETSLSVLVRGGASERIRWNSFLQPFGNTLWSALLSSVTVLTLVLTVLWRVENSTYLQGTAQSGVSISEVLLCVLGAACMQGHASPPNSTSARWVHLTALVSAVVIVAVYSSSVTAFLAVTREDKPFSTLSQLLANSHFRPFTLAGSPEHTIFQDSLHPIIMRHRAESPPSSLPSLSTALLVTCGHNSSLLGRWSSRVPALIIPSLWADRILSLAPCKLMHFALTDAAEQQLWAAFPISTKLPFTRLINKRLHQMHESGAILHWHVQIARRAAYAQDDVTEVSRFSVSMVDIIPLLALLGCGAMLAICLLLLEKLFKYSTIKIAHTKPHYAFRM